MDQQFEDIDSSGQWQNLYNEIRNQASEYSYKMAKLPENRNLNRYRDVSPYDHSRVKLEHSENDYINASLVVVEEAQRTYILSQGPLRNTCGHFWLMIWEQNSKAVIMLNRIIEKGSEKCAQYWPTAEEHQLCYTDTGFVVTLVKEEDKSYYIIRVLELRNTETGRTREIYHFHYTTWPDFGVPESPASFLNFLVKVRESGSLGAEHGPAVVHCSAGIGRSGTFSLVDTCLILMDKRKDPSSVDIQRVLLDMREYRMGLIQTPDQLRFSYRAVLEGAKCIVGDCSAQSQWRDLSREDRETVCESPPAPPPRCLPAPPPPPPRPLDTPAPPSPSRPSDKPNGQPLPCVEPEAVALSREDGTSGDGPDPDSYSSEKDRAEVTSLRRRHREERIASTAQKLHLMKQRLTDTERQRERWLYWRPILLNVGAGAAVALGLMVVWFFSQ
ncbi:tyrosine-protein phosphatase non-receptor type 2 isoform X1 [Coregonus clupeaformis]|uniref:tyrosine-protein phosphatase non-receptor type 2 isoform X1 n=2 Tax=Coregonus clupeaformis TaxID=59861 RepID=UPI001BDF9C3D|nr:tyrosine-protein phosphatase non-receptor type 2 isoform X1 [Coregonus clupeaformis]XP_045082078.1 tyrosine-protein phosphatase non-receptor type 2 isoform X1 [Coregonus clupeaformis]